VAVLTASERASDLAVCRRLGVEAYVRKPVEFVAFTEIAPQLRLRWALLPATPTAE